MKLNNLELKDIPNSEAWIANAILMYEYLDDDGDLRLGYIKPADQSNTVTIGMIERIRNAFLAVDLNGWNLSDDEEEDD